MLSKMNIVGTTFPKTLAQQRTGKCCSFSALLTTLFTEGWDGNFFQFSVVYVTDVIHNNPYCGFSSNLQMIQNKIAII